MQRVKPSLFASAILSSQLFTARISPARPTSPKAMVLSSTALSFNDETSASATVKSAAGSSSFKPPITLTYASLLLKRYQALFSRTARSILILL